MNQPLQAIRGMHDIVPDEAALWSYLEEACRQVASAYGYREVRFPIVESTALFHRSIGEVTDVVEKEMYSFEDRNGDSLSLRPEGTAGCVRAGIEQGLFYNQIQRLWYLGPMFRHERPQKGRCRQFHQFGIEAYGMSEPEVDAEVILLSQRLFQALGVQEALSLELNSLGSAESRARYREHLVRYFEQHRARLDEDSQRRLSLNPLRILDSKNPAMQTLIEQAPRLSEYADDESKQHFERLCHLLDQAGVRYRLNPRLVRGLDYYDFTVFEWTTTSLGAQGTVCGGGRYNTLVERLGGKPTPAMGFSLGIERVVALLEQQKKEAQPVASADIYLVLQSQSALQQGLLLAEALRNALNYRVVCNLDGSGFKTQFKRADKSGARWAIVIAETEMVEHAVMLKDLSSGEQIKLAQDKVTDYFKKL